MWTLIFYAVVIGGGVLFVETFIHNHDAKVKQGVVDVWKPIVDTQIKATETAVGAANQNLATAHTFRDQAQLCSKGTKALEKAAKDAKAERDRVLASNQGRLAQLEADRVKHEQQTTVSDAGATCEQKLGTIGGTLGDLGARRLRDHPPGASGNSSGTPAPSGTGSGPDTLRLNR